MKLLIRNFFHFKSKRRQLVVFSVAAFALLLSANALLPLKLPDEHTSYSQLVLAENGQILRAFADQQGIWRQKVSYQQVSPLYLQALLNYEDKYFWQHPGINPVALLRAFYLNWQCGCIVSGGSTISMQVARILHPHSRTIAGKLYQVFRTLQLEWQLSKAEILNLYLNFAPFGGTVEGVEAASFAYLDKSSQQLTHAEAALLAVLPQSPSKIRPDRQPALAQRARDKVLDRMLSSAVWTVEEVSDAKLEVVTADRPARPNSAPLLARYLSQKYPNKKKIKTTINYPLQQGLEQQLSSFIDSQPQGSSGAILVMDNQTGQVKAYLGSADFANRKRFGHVDMIRAIRSPGSTLKPFIYGLALDKGLIHSKSLLTDSPRLHSDYKPENFARSFSGPVSVTEALQRSLNVPAVQVLEQLGPSSFYNALISAGVPLVLPSNSQPNLSIALGGVGINLWSLVTAYSSLTQQGLTVSPQLELGKPAQQPRYLLSAQAAWISYQMLKSNLRPDAIYSENLRTNTNVIAWKTGTSYGYRDAWAIGSSAQYTIGVWLGRPDGTPQPGHFGSFNAAPLLFTISDRLHQGNQVDIPKPDGVQVADICWPLGQIKTKLQVAKGLCHQSHGAMLIEGLEPQTFLPSQNEPWLMNPISLWLDSSNNKLASFACGIKEKQQVQVALWPKELEPWLPAHYKRQSLIPAPSERCQDVVGIDFDDLTITGLEQGSKLMLLDNGDAPLLPIQAIGGSGIRDWYINGKYIKSLPANSTFFYSFDQLGKQQIMVLDQQGASDMVELEVLRSH